MEDKEDEGLKLKVLGGPYAVTLDQICERHLKKHQNWHLLHICAFAISSKIAP